MNYEHEIEFKTLLSKRNYHKLIDHFSISSSAFFTQENIYFDTKKKDLSQKKCALRIRIKDGTYTLTLKEQNIRSNLETNQRISPEKAIKLLNRGQLPPGPVQIKLHALNVHENLDVLTRVVTKRAEIPYQGQTLFFDQSVYEGMIDYELELETTDYKRGKQVFKTLLASLDIPYRPSKPKVYRALKQKEKSANNT